jgi:hypothetical protein
MTLCNLLGQWCSSIAGKTGASKVYLRRVRVFFFLFFFSWRWWMWAIAEPCQLGATFYDPPNTISLFFHTLVCVCVCTELLHIHTHRWCSTLHTSRGFYITCQWAPEKSGRRHYYGSGGGLNRKWPSIIFSDSRPKSSFFFFFFSLDAHQRSCKSFSAPADRLFLHGRESV